MDLSVYVGPRCRLRNARKRILSFDCFGSRSSAQINSAGPNGNVNQEEQAHEAKLISKSADLKPWNLFSVGVPLSHIASQLLRGD